MDSLTGRPPSFYMFRLECSGYIYAVGLLHSDVIRSESSPIRVAMLDRSGSAARTPRYS